MKKFTEQLKKRAESVKLRGFERNNLRERLVSYMEYHPLPQDLKDKQLMPAVVPTRTSFVQVAMFSRYMGALTVLFLVMVPFVAEKAVPGDVLYPVKVRFNEEIRGSLTFSPYEKVEWETSRLERRIAEARLLANEGKLTPEVEESVAEAVKQHSDAAQREIAVIRAGDSEQAVIAEITLASALEVQSEVLAGHTARDIGATMFGRSVVGLSGAVDAARKTVESAQTSEKPSYAKLSAKVELETTKAQELFNSVSQNATAEEVASIERRLSDINNKVAKAINLHNTKPEDIEALPINSDAETASSSEVAVEEPGEPSAAASTTPEALPKSEEVIAEAIEVAVILTPEEVVINLLREALMDTQKLISFMTDIDVRQNVSIEELVPMEKDSKIEEKKTDSQTSKQAGENTTLKMNIDLDTDI